MLIAYRMPATSWQATSWSRRCVECQLTRVLWTQKRQLQIKDQPIARKMPFYQLQIHTQTKTRKNAYPTNYGVTADTLAEAFQIMARRTKGFTKLFRGDESDIVISSHPIEQAYETFYAAPLAKGRGPFGSVNPDSSVPSQRKEGLKIFRALQQQQLKAIRAYGVLNGKTNYKKKWQQQLKSNRSSDRIKKIVADAIESEADARVKFVEEYTTAKKMMKEADRAIARGDIIGAPPASRDLKACKSVTDPDALPPRNKAMRETAEWASEMQRMAESDM